MYQRDGKEELKEKNIKISTVLYSFLILLVVVLIIMSVLAYGTNTMIGNRMAGYLSRAIPFPAALVGYSEIIYLKDVEGNLSSLQQFYQTEDFSDSGLRVDFTTEEGKKRLIIKEREILNKMIEDRAVEILAKKRGVTVSRKDLDEAVAKKIAQSGTAEEVKDDLFKKYGWTLEEFKDKIVFPELLREALSESVLAEITKNDTSKEQIQKAQTDLQAGKSFTEVVKTYSDGDSRDSEGEIGWVKKEQVLPELQEQLFGNIKPEKNSILESSIGFHIVEIENRKKEDNEDVLQLRQIFVKKSSFPDWLEEQMREMKIMIPLSGFVWNKDEAVVDFRDDAMKEFERKSREKLEGDASIMF